MANALGELLERLQDGPLPSDYPISKVSKAMKHLGYTETIESSHHKFRKKGSSPLVIAVKSGNKVPQAALKDLRQLFKGMGLQKPHSSLRGRRR